MATTLGGGPAGADAPERDVDTGSAKLRLRIAEDGVATLTFDDPENRNPLGYDLRPVFRRAVDLVAADDAVRCLVLTGAGRAFCAGGNAKAMATQEQPPLEERIRAIRSESEAVAVLHEMPKPVVAALPGAAAGAGFAIALAADVRIAAESAFLVAAFAKLGLPGDFGGSWLLTQLVGPAKAREIYFGGERLDARACLALGLFNRVVPDAELQTAARAWARELAAGPPVALRMMKANLNRALHADLRTCIAEEAERQCWAAETDDFREATRAFAEKRAPVFRGR
ncbi:MAG: enoyl-CoA hydratase-related protein [Myxococcota bacterium]|nr:enoyl-CoA hydratase/isomerase family protein [Myxococcales bacterium]